MITITLDASPALLAAVNDLTAAIVRAAQRVAEPAPAPPAPPLPPAPAPIAAPPSPPLMRSSAAPRVAVPFAATTLDATFATIRQRAGVWGITFEQASDLPAVNAKARRLGLPAFNLVKG